MAGFSKKSRGLRVCIVAAALMLASHAQAETTEAAPQVDLVLVGGISASCAIGEGGTVDLGELRGGLGFTAQIGFDCNVPFDMVLQSSRGGIVNDEKPLGEGPYSGALEYSVTLNVPVTAPAAGSLQGTFTSSQLRATRTLSSGEAIAAGGVSLALITHEPTGAGLLAGTYSDVLTVTINPRT